MFNQLCIVVACICKCVLFPCSCTRISQFIFQSKGCLENNQIIQNVSLLTSFNKSTDWFFVSFVPPIDIAYIYIKYIKLKKMYYGVDNYGKKDICMLITFLIKTDLYVK